MWALRLKPSLAWFRSTLPDFPLLGASRFAIQPYMTPRPHKREEIFIFGGHLEATGGVESEVLDAFFTLDLRSWRAGEAEVPRTTWGDVEKKLLAAGKDDTEMEKARTDWEEEQKRKQKEILRANRRKARREKLRGKKKGADPKAADNEAGGTSGAASAEEEDELSDEEAIAAREAEKEFELPPETMPTLTFGDWVPLRVGTHLPPPRFGHAMTMAGSVAYVFGGRNRSRRFDGATSMRTLSRQLALPRINRPPRSCARVGSEPVMNDFYSFDATPLAWQSVSYDGDGPGARVSHAMVHLEHYLYVLGGGGGNRSFNDLHRLDLYTMHWELIHARGAAPGAKPDALIGHSVAWVDPYLVVFAGGDGRRPSNDLHTLELRTATWRQVDTTGAPPAPRVGHSSTLQGADMYIIGGFSRGKYFHDVHVLQVETLQWSQAVTAGTPPHGRVSHTATLYEGSIHLFGGSAGGLCFNDYLVLTPAPTSTAVANASKSTGRRQAQWSAPEVAGFPPEPRYSHTATVVGPLLFIVGGLTRKGKPHNDLHVLDLSTLAWSMPRVTHEGPAPRGRHTTIAVDSALFLFGGGAHGELYDDIWTLDVDGKGLERLKQLATRDAESAGAVEQQIPTSFLAPHLGKVTPVEEIADEFESLEAREANADEVRSWLTHLGLAQHAYTFEAHEIDFEVLLQLQDHDLVDMRIDDPMQRLRLLNGIEVLRARGSLTAVGRAPSERLFRQRYRLGAEVNFGGHPAVLAVDCKTDVKVVVKFVPDMVDYHRQGASQVNSCVRCKWQCMFGCILTSPHALYAVALHKELKSAPIARLADSYAAVRPGQLLPGDHGGELQRGWGLPCLVLEYGESSLADYMNSGQMAPVELKACFEAMLRAVIALHAHGYAHCALQPESFRLYGGAGWQLATLDSVTKFGEATPAKCPVCYAAPEVVTHLRRPGGVTQGKAIVTAPASAAMDVWSLGVLLWQLFSQQPLVSTEAEALAMLPSLRSIELSLGCVTDLQARHLLYKMLQRDEAERITPQQILKSGYLTGGLDTIQMETTFGPMQKGQLFVRSLLQNMSEGFGKRGHERRKMQG